MKLTLFLASIVLLSASQAWAFGKGPVEPPVVIPPKPPVETSPDVIRARWEGKQRDGHLWSQHVFDTLPILGKDLLAKRPGDISSFCANYSDLSTTDKKNFWVYLVSAMTELESSHNPDTSYTEAFPDSQGNRVVSRGLLQISIESGNAYGCGFKSTADLHDPYKNLDCGLRILNRWIGGDGVISGKSGTSWRGGARYWAVLRKDTHLVKIRGWVQDQDICQVR